MTDDFQILWHADPVRALVEKARDEEPAGSEARAFAVRLLARRQIALQSDPHLNDFGHRLKKALGQSTDIGDPDEREPGEPTITLRMSASFAADLAIDLLVVATWLRGFFAAQGQENLGVGQSRIEQVEEVHHALKRACQKVGEVS